MQNNVSENILIEGLKASDRRIFDYLFHTYYSGLVVFADKYVNNKNAAEDLVQDFFLKLWLNREKTEINQNIKTYFFISIKNRCLDYIRHQQVKQKAAEFIIQPTEITTDSSDYLIETELRERIEIALNKLPEKCRQVFVLNRFEGLSAQEIALKEAISVRTVEAHIGKALKIMRHELEPYLPELLIMMVLKNMA